MKPWQIDADQVSDLAQRMVGARSPSPPGDVNDVARVVTSYLDEHSLGYRIQRLASDRVNLVCTVDSGEHGRQVVLSGHLDTFPESCDQQHRTPRGTDTGRAVYGRGIADMKGGVAGFLLLLERFAHARRHWRGRLSAVLVCDEETFGPHGARRLLLDKSLLDVDAVLTAEPSGRGRIRYGERGPVWGAVQFRGPDGHAAYSHGKAGNPIEQAATFASIVREHFCRAFPTSESTPPTLVTRDAADASITVATVRGGSKVNTHPSDCVVEVDVRVPVGCAASDVVSWMTELALEHGGEYRVDVAGDANLSDPEDPLFTAIGQAVREETGVDPLFEVARGSTDGRLWRRHGVPVAQYGADPLMQATPHEHVTVHELGEIARVHARAAWMLLTE